MSKANEKLEELLSRTYADITMHAIEDRMPTAEKAFYSIRDYALGDTVSCTGDAALENCEQIRVCFPANVPKSVLENLEAVQEEIVRIEKSHSSFLAGRLWWIIIVAAIVFFVYFVITFRN